jgi:DinB family protein
MQAHDAIKLSIDMGNMLSMAYIEDLNDQDLLRRPSPGCNHINWQIGHLISSEHRMGNTVAPGSMPDLPAGFADKYTKETALIDDPAKFCTKSELLAVYKQQRGSTLAALSKVSEADLDRTTGVDYAPTVGAMFSLQGSHWLMHCGQWAVVRRQLGRPPLF